jgi:hypothetical protein
MALYVNNIITGEQNSILSDRSRRSFSAIVPMYLPKLMLCALGFLQRLHISGAGQSLFHYLIRAQQ